MLRTGEILSNRYEIIELVGSGGMASVYKAKDHRLNRLVAIKVLASQFGEDQTFIKKFDIEAQLVAALVHPNIVNVYDFGDEKGLHFIVMEYVDGETLKEYITSKGGLDIEQAVELSIQIASGIKAAHDNKTIHRDIKPQNILILSDGKTVKITDFGIAKTSNMSTIQTTTMGSVHYLPPEQARGGYTDERSDIYSLGITMYEMVVGKVPFDGENNVEIALKHLEDDPVPPRELRPGIPENLEKIILKCMRKRKDDRYQSMEAVISDLKQVFVEEEDSFVLSEQLQKNQNENEFSTIILKRDDLNKIKSEMPNSDDSLEEDETEEEILEESEEKIDPKLEKVIVGLTALTVLIIISAILYFFVMTTGILGPKDSSNAKATTVKNLTTVEVEKVTEEPDQKGTEDNQENTEEVIITEGERFVPNLIGLKKEEAKEKLEKKALKPEYMYQYSDVAEDYVIGQSIDAGTKLEKDSLVTLTVSQGKKDTTVSNVVGMTEKQATDELEKSGLNVKISYIYSDTEEQNRVISQSVDAGAKIRVGEKISLVVSLGKEETKITVPDLSYYTEGEARTQLERFGLKLGSVEKKNSDTIAKGQIISQSIEPKKKVEGGSIIDVVISSGVDESKYIYKGNIIISSPPFSTETKENANLTLTLLQNEEKKIFYDGLVTEEDFPLEVDFEGLQEGIGVIDLEVDGEQIKDSYIVQVNKVEK